MKNRLEKNKKALKIALIVYVGITTAIFFLLNGWIISFNNSLVTYVATVIYLIPVMALIVVFARDKRTPKLVRTAISLILIPWTMYIVFGFIIELVFSMIGKV